MSALNSAMLTAEANRDVRGLSIGLQAIKAPWVAPALREGKRHMAEQEAQRLQQERIARAAEVGAPRLVHGNLTWRIRARRTTLPLTSRFSRSKTHIVVAVDKASSELCLLR